MRQLMAQPQKGSEQQRSASKASKVRSPACKVGGGGSAVVLACLVHTQGEFVGRRIMEGYKAGSNIASCRNCAVGNQ